MNEPAKEAADRKPGIQCRHCGCTDLRVRHTRRHSGRIRRERECRHCGKVIWTTEKE